MKLTPSVPVRIGDVRYTVAKVATCEVCGEGIAYLKQPRVWLHRHSLKMVNALDKPKGVAAYNHRARPSHGAGLQSGKTPSRESDSGSAFSEHPGASGSVTGQVQS